MSSNSSLRIMLVLAMLHRSLTATCENIEEKTAKLDSYLNYLTNDGVSIDGEDCETNTFIKFDVKKKGTTENVGKAVIMTKKPNGQDAVNDWLCFIVPAKPNVLDSSKINTIKHTTNMTIEDFLEFNDDKTISLDGESGILKQKYLIKVALKSNLETIVLDFEFLKHNDEIEKCFEYEDYSSPILSVSVCNALKSLNSSISFMLSDILKLSGTELAYCLILQVAKEMRPRSDDEDLNLI